MPAYLPACPSENSGQGKEACRVVQRESPSLSLSTFQPANADGCNGRKKDLSVSQTTRRKKRQEKRGGGRERTMEEKGRERDTLVDLAFLSKNRSAYGHGRKEYEERGKMEMEVCL
mmetsp:Transcript_1670/g.3430  ORF Transcript_1670/g.3430 Transcript_1670/m.3430 type:complete len:116 (-) Transcript_1670:256-603(-)